MIALEEVRAVLRGYIPVRDLCIDRSHTTRPFSRLLLCIRTRCNAAMSAVVTHAVDGDVVDDGFVDIHITNDRGIHMADSGIVVEVVSSPAATFIAIAVIAVAVVHAAIEADLRTPVSSVPKVATATPAPPSRCPQQTNRRRHHPCARHPVIVVSVPCPVSGGPDVIGSGTKRLVINRKRWRRSVNSYSYAYLRE